MLLSLLEGTKGYIYREDNNIPYQLILVPLLLHITWTCCKKLFQWSYVQGEDFNLVLDGDSFLQMGWSKERFEQGAINKLCD